MFIQKGEKMIDKFETKSKYIAFYGIMLAFTLLLAVIESMFISIFPAIPGIKLGVSNVIIMYCILFFDKSAAIQIAVLKSFFIFLIRGATAFIFSFSGSVFAVLVMIIISSALRKLRLTPVLLILISICGAVTHNVVQIIIASILTSTNLIVYYIPVVVLAGISFGAMTGVLISLLHPYIKRLKR